MTPRQTFDTVADYLAALAPSRAKVLRDVLRAVRKSVPDAESVISYGIPAFRKERVFIYCAAFKRHIGIYPPVQEDAGLKSALKPYANAKGNLSFPLDEPMPLQLMARVAKALARQHATGKESARKRKAGERKPSRDNSAKSTRKFHAPTDAVLDRLRSICLGYPGVSETGSWGHPNFRTRERIFVAYEEHANRPSIAIRLVADQVRELCAIKGFFPARYGKGLWVGIHADGRLNWRLIRKLIDESYGLASG